MTPEQQSASAGFGYHGLPLPRGMSGNVDAYLSHQGHVISAGAAR